LIGLSIWDAFGENRIEIRLRNGFLRAKTRFRCTGAGARPCAYLARAECDPPSWGRPCLCWARPCHCCRFPEHGFFSLFRSQTYTFGSQTPKPNVLMYNWTSKGA